MALESVAAYRNVIEPYLDRPESDYAGLIDQLRHQNEADTTQGQPAQFAAIETVFRDKFYEILATTEIFDTAFDSVWHLLDVVATLSDKELCESGLIFWLIEELLDSQTIDGCRKVFDYLESRRERITSKHFKQKQLIILRCCNELLRRLSRAEDIVFCGRVFIFLFQSFPLGDKSSVNLRGEYHVENVTIFDAEHKKSEDAIKPMELDSKDRGPPESSDAGTPAALGAETTESQISSKTTLKPSQSGASDSQPDLDALYPQFWALQTYCSAPTRLFDPNNLKLFKEGIAATMACFQQMGAHAAPSNRQDESKRGIKRKHSEMGNEIASTFNPKYLTNRDLFDLEVHDIAFRRHILVQMLILLDFLLSLTQSAKAKLADLTNKSVLYAYTLSAEDTEWATSTRASIASYLQQGSSNEGKFYYRMVDTVLSRDKNWVRWKAENCPPIDRPSVDVQHHLDAQKALEKLCIKKPLPTPPGANDLEFLSETAPIESLKDSSRYTVPTMQKFYEDIMKIELDQDFAGEDERRTMEESKERTLWRALRASQHRFTLCEKMGNGKNPRALLGDDVKDENIAPAETGDDNEA
jgi:THO complex subunit 1